MSVLRRYCMASTIGVRTWAILLQGQKLSPGLSAMLGGFANQYANTHGAAPTMCKAPYLVLWECKERLQQFMTSKEVYSLLLKWTYFIMQTDVPGWSFWGEWWREDGKGITLWRAGEDQPHPEGWQKVQGRGHMQAASVPNEKSKTGFGVSPSLRARPFQGSPQSVLNLSDSGAILWKSCPLLKHVGRWIFMKSWLFFCNLEELS